MKKRIIFRISGGKEWIGGLYYCRNILFSMVSNKFITSKYEIVLCLTKQNRDLFSDFNKMVEIIELPEKNTFFNIGILLRILQIKTKFVYYQINAKLDSIIGKKSIYWIPDFQYLYYPEYFSEEEIKIRDERYERIARGKGKLVLSSYTCKKDFEEKYPDHTVEIFVVPFISYIEPQIKQITVQRENAVLKSFGLEQEKYIYVPNQFWQHKNHLIVLKAMEIILERQVDFPFKLVFTGELKDFRNKEYLEKLKSFMEKDEIKKNICNLGFINRGDQIIIMKNAKFLIQPSLFEGWGTVLEDAKVLDKTVILSDIPIHREQKSNTCILFNPNLEEELAECILRTVNQRLNGNVNSGIEKMHENAKTYSFELQKLFEC